MYAKKVKEKKREIYENKKHITEIMMHVLLHEKLRKKMNSNIFIVLCM
jgi:hypothetical protein